jgi:hypothetical protein
MFKRILMNAADGSPGNGAPAPAATPTDPPPQAQGAAPTITMTKADLDAAIAAGAAKAVADVRDSIYADARRSTAGSNKSKPKGDETPAGPAPLSATEERTYLRGLDRTIATLGLKPNGAQYASAERDLLSDRPENVDAWVKERFEGFGGSQPATPAAPAAQPVAPAQPQNALPASSRGAPPAPQVALEEIDLWTASDSDRQAFIKQKGIKAYNEKLRAQGKGRAVSFR